RSKEGDAACHSGLNMGSSAAFRLRCSGTKGDVPYCRGRKEPYFDGRWIRPSEARFGFHILRETRDGSQEEVVQEGQEVHRQASGGKEAREEEDGSKAETQSGIHEGNEAQRSAGGGSRLERPAPHRSDEEAVGVHQAEGPAGQDQPAEHPR